VITWKPVLVTFYNDDQMILAVKQQNQTDLATTALQQHLSLFHTIFFTQKSK